MSSDLGNTAGDDHLLESVELMNGCELLEFLKTPFMPNFKTPVISGERRIKNFTELDMDGETLLMTTEEDFRRKYMLPEAFITRIMLAIDFLKQKGKKRHAPDSGPGSREGTPHKKQKIGLSLLMEENLCMLAPVP